MTTLDNQKPFTHDYFNNIKKIATFDFQILSIISSTTEVLISDCQFSQSHHHQNHLTNKVKNRRDKIRWIFAQSRKDSGFCNVPCGRYTKKCFTQILQGFVCRHQRGGRKLTKTYVLEFSYEKPAVVFWGFTKISMIAHSHTRTVQIAKSQQLSYLFLTYVTAF